MRGLRLACGPAHELYGLGIGGDATAGNWCDGFRAGGGLGNGNRLLGDCCKVPFTAAHANFCGSGNKRTALRACGLPGGAQAVHDAGLHGVTNQNERVGRMFWLVVSMRAPRAVLLRGYKVTC